MKTLRFICAAALAAALFAGCNKHSKPERQSNSGNENNGGSSNGQRQEQVITLKQNTDWVISYEGRQLVNGSKVEVIDVSGITCSNYLVSAINRDNYSSYDGDLKSFMETELEYAGDYIYNASQESIIFDPFRHGTWYAFVIALDSDKALTGEYNYIKFTVEEEEPTEDFLKWTGKWTATDGKISYELTVSSVEANYVYRVDGWETGRNVTEQMNQEYLETFYDGGRMYFTSQYIQSYEEDNVTMEECFLGEIDYDGILHTQGLYLIPDEGMDLAYAETAEDGSVSILPCRVIADIDGEEFEAPFYDMKYFVWSTGESTWYHYNDDVAVFPITMTKVVDTDTQPSAICRRGVVNTQKALRGRVFTAPHGSVQRASTVAVSSKL